jgi:uncharacterized protein (TIGR02147 family)
MSNVASDTHLKAPAIWDFVEPVQFLKAQYQHRKSCESDFSFATWASELGLKSRSFLRLVLIGKRSLTEDLAHLFIQNLQLNKSETLYFTHLVGLHRASQLQTKEFHSREISKLRKKFLLKRHAMVEVDRADLFDFLSSYQIPRLQTLLTIEDVEKTVPNLARLLKMKDSEVSLHLHTLQKLGLAEKSEGEARAEKWTATQSRIGAPDALGNIALQSFHRKSLEEAIQALTLPKETRRYQSLVLPLTMEQLQELNEEVQQTFQACLQKFEPQIGGEKRIYQINLNIIPVSESIDRPQKDETVESGPAQKEEKL